MSSFEETEAVPDAEDETRLQDVVLPALGSRRVYEDSSDDELPLPRLQPVMAFHLPQRAALPEASAQRVSSASAAQDESDSESDPTEYSSDDAEDDEVQQVDVEQVLYPSRQQRLSCIMAELRLTPPLGAVLQFRIERDRDDSERSEDSEDREESDRIDDDYTWLASALQAEGHRIPRSAAVPRNLIEESDSEEENDSEEESDSVEESDSEDSDSSDEDSSLSSSDDDSMPPSLAPRRRLFVHAHWHDEQLRRHNNGNGDDTIPPLDEDSDDGIPPLRRRDDVVSSDDDSSSDSDLSHLMSLPDDDSSVDSTDSGPQFIPRGLGRVMRLRRGQRPQPHSRVQDYGKFASVSNTDALANLRALDHLRYYFFGEQSFGNLTAVPRIAELVRRLEEATDLRVLGLHFAELNPEEHELLPQVAQALQSHIPTLERVRVWGVHNDSIECLLEALCPAQALKQVEVRGSLAQQEQSKKNKAVCCVSPETLERLVTAPRTDPCSFSLRGLGLGDMHCRVLSDQVLHKEQTGDFVNISTVDLTQNPDISDAGYEALERMAQRCAHVGQITVDHGRWQDRLAFARTMIVRGRLRYCTNGTFVDASKWVAWLGASQTLPGENLRLSILLHALQERPDWIHSHRNSDYRVCLEQEEEHAGVDES